LVCPTSATFPELVEPPMVPADTEAEPPAPPMPPLPVPMFAPPADVAASSEPAAALPL